MAVYKRLARQFEKYLPPGEDILATVATDFGMAHDKYRFCVTHARLGALERKGLFSWSYYPMPFKNIKAVWAHEGLFNSTLVILLDTGDEARLDHIDKTNAREFVAAYTYCTEHFAETASQQTKVCPDCDEIVKMRAKLCKHCGHKFSG